ncbi:hypothetical protein [Steroidobacter cummioxidans]|uniref:hypothetical protein n=1 Tax=Steroidobacter cummioxidans TaxID=1803913 RepID=UPI000E3168EE
MGRRARTPLAKKIRCDKVLRNAQRVTTKWHVCCYICCISDVRCIAIRVILLVNDPC